MKKIYLAIVLAAIMAPVNILAENLGDNHCFVRVVHTNFSVGNGKIIRSNGELYFARVYLTECRNAADGYEVVSAGSNPVTPPPQSGGNSFVNFLTGEPCFVPVYHANFLLPSEGGAVIRANNQLYFVPTYISRCAEATAGFEIVRRATDPPPTGDVGVGAGGSVVNFLVGNPCLTPVYHVNFNLNGGKIVRIGSDLWYVKTYLSGCSTLPAGSVLVVQ